MSHQVNPKYANERAAMKLKVSSRLLERFYGDRLTIDIVPAPPEETGTEEAP